jgi:hypothetical protein
MPIDFTIPQYNQSKTANSSIYPLFAQSTGNNFDRIEPLVTPDILISDWLFSVPLYDRVNKRQITKEDLKRVINRAVNQCELDLKINIFPVQRSYKMPFDASLFRQFGYTELPTKPIYCLLDVFIEDSNFNNTYQFPPQIIDTSNLTLGMVSFGPVSIATANGNVLNTLAASGGGSLILTTFINLNFIPQFMRWEYISGFPENQIPTSLNEVIGITAALEIFSRIAPMFKTNSQSLSHDALSQSTSGPGPNTFNNRIDQLQAKRAQLLKQLKHTFYNSIMVSNV